MNFYVTSAAARALGDLINRRATGKAVLIEANEDGGFKIEVLDSLEQPDVIMIDAAPPTFTTLFTLRKLRDSSIDFDHAENGFVIRLHNVVHPSA
jgi:hypothetical protein